MAWDPQQTHPRLALRTRAIMWTTRESLRTASSNLAEKSAEFSRRWTRLTGWRPLFWYWRLSLWLPQAGLLAMGVGEIVAGSGMANIHWLVVGVVADRHGPGAARCGWKPACFSHRPRCVVREARRGGGRAGRSVRRWISIGPPPGFAASVLAEQAEAIVPYLSRFRPARLKATIVPIAIVLCVLPLSWAAAISC